MISLSVAREPHMLGDLTVRDKFSTGLEITKETLYFQNEGIACIKAPKGLQGTLGGRINDEIITDVERNTRKGVENNI